jgi:hypothetical protein
MKRQYSSLRAFILFCGIPHRVQADATLLYHQHSPPSFIHPTTYTSLQPCQRRISQVEIGASSSLVRLSLEKRDDSSVEQGDSTEKKKGSKMERYSVWGEMAPPSEAAMDSFLRGDYHKSFSSDAGPHPGLGPGDTVHAALTALRDRDSDHGAAVFLRFCAPLKRGERWGGGTVPDAWKEVMR